MEIVTQLALILIIGVISGLIALKLKMPLIIGYILGGAVTVLIFNPDTLSTETLHQLGELGIALLLFSIGIEFSVQKLLEVKKFAVIGGVVQIILTIVFGLIFFPLLGFNDFQSLFLGSVFSLSSTALIVKILEDLGQLETHAAKITIGWLIVQDIAVVFIILFLDSFAKGSSDPSYLLESLLKSFLLIAGSLIIGRKVIPKILTSVANLGSHDLLVITAFCFCLLFAFISESLGVSFTLGAFIAGLMISESFLNHEILIEIKPLQNIFAMIFFITIGSLFSLTEFSNNLIQILIVFVVVMLVKFLLVIAIGLVLKLHIRNVIEVALSIAHVGEFAFLSSQIGLTKGWINTDLYNLVISVTILSLLVTPFLLTKSDRIYDFIREKFKSRFPEAYRRIFMSPNNDVEDQDILKNHIIICGFGKVGRYISEALKKLKIKFFIIDINAEHIQLVQQLGYPALYGDATSEELLEQAGLANARAVVVALPKSDDAKLVVERIISVNPDIEIIVRKRGENLQEISESNSIEPEFETALRIVERTLTVIGRKERGVLKWLRNQNLNISSES